MVQPTAPTLLSVDPNTIGAAYGQNPYAASMNSDSQAAQAGINSANMALMGMGAQSSAMGGQSASSLYPSYPNSYGLGSQNPMAAIPSFNTPQNTAGFTAPAPAAQVAPVSSSQSAAASDPSSRGFNPWSLQGESNVR